LQVIKPSNYVIALRASTCEACGNLTLKIIKDSKDVEGNDKSNSNIGNISLKDKNSGLKWLYSNSTYLRKGAYELQINSDSKMDLDSVVLYSVGSNNSHDNNTAVHNETLEQLFNPQVSAPAQIAAYKKINPTKHIVNIENATRPYMISFAESYDPLWRAYVSDENNSDNSNSDGDSMFSKSIPLYSVVNGFYINKTGDYSLIIEYQPQKWFIQGATISIISLVALFAGFLILSKRRTIARIYLTIKNTLSTYHKDGNTDRVKNRNGA
jgi:hypothetical protein